MIVAVENNKHILDKIRKILFKYDIDYKTFLDFTPEFYEIMKNDMLKIYILDIYLPSGYGIDIVKEIRKKDWDSIIIILLTDMLPMMIISQQMLMILTFVYKVYNFENRLEKVLNRTIKEIFYRKEKIISVEKIKGTKKCIVKTNIKEYEINNSLKYLKEKYNLKQVSRDRLER